MNDSTQTRELPAVVYWGAPLLVVGAPYTAQWAGGRQAWLYGEAGAIEWLTVVFLLAAIVYGVCVLRLAAGRGPRWLVVWALLLLLGAVYFAGEELSWGQHVFQWTTPETWRQLNPQQETNLHNVHALFDQLPRALLTLAAFVGGIVVPLYRRRAARRRSVQQPTLEQATEQTAPRAAAQHLNQPAPEKAAGQTAPRAAAQHHNQPAPEKAAGQTAPHAAAQHHNQPAPEQAAGQTAPRATQGRLARLLSEDDRNAWPYWLWPTWVCLPVSVLVLVASPFDGLVESFGDAAPDWLYMKGGELKECLLALFISIYVVSLHRRLRAAAAPSAPSSPSPAAPPPPPSPSATPPPPQGRC